MKLSAKDQWEGIAHEVKGAVKEKVGHVTDNPDCRSALDGYRGRGVPKPNGGCGPRTLALSEFERPNRASPISGFTTSGPAGRRKTPQAANRTTQG